MSKSIRYFRNSHQWIRFFCSSKTREVRNGKVSDVRVRREEDLILAADDFTNRVLRPYAPGLDNIVLNKNANDGFTHIELGPDSIRLEFSDVGDPTYQYFASAFLGFDDNVESETLGLSEDAMALRPAVQDVRNSTFCGAGATMYVTYLCSSRVLGSSFVFRAGR